MTSSLVTARNLELVFFSGALGYLLFEAFGKKPCLACPACGGPSNPPIVSAGDGGGDLPPGAVIDTMGVDTTEASPPIFVESTTVDIFSAPAPATVTRSRPPRSNLWGSRPAAYGGSSSSSAAPPPPAPADGGSSSAPSSAPPPTTQAPSRSQQAPPPHSAPSGSSGRTFTTRRR